MFRFGNSGKWFICPKCKKRLFFKEKSLVCDNGHCYDIGKQGYVNLAPGLKPQKNYNKSSFENRRTILEHGFYDHILKEILEILDDLPSFHTFLDVGCGEGFYAKQIARKLGREVLAFDISKDSIRLAAKSDAEKKVKWFIADLTQLPIKDHSIDCILNLFTPANYKEFPRILTERGYLLKVIPGENHLIQLRELVKDQLIHKNYSNENTVTYFEKYFSPILHKKVTATYQLRPEDRDAVIHMSPLLFHVEKDAVRWEDLKELTIEGEILLGKPLKQTFKKGRK